jgi:hypothetical protein
MRRLRKVLTYGNITATIAVFLAMSGVAAAVTLAPKNSVTSASIKDGEVRTPDVRGGAVTAAKIAANSIGSGKVVDGSLNGVDVRDDSVGASDLASGSVGTSEIADDSVSGTKIPEGEVRSSEIANYSIGSNDINGNQIGALQVKDLVTATSGGTYVSAGGYGSAQVTCPDLGMVVGGGFAWQDEESNSIIYSTPSESDPNHSWTVSGMASGGSSNTLYAWASCLSL